MNQPDETWLRRALVAAVQRPPQEKRDWSWSAHYAERGARLAPETIRAQFSDRAFVAGREVPYMLRQWATTGRWSRPASDAAAFLRVALAWAGAENAVPAKQGSRAASWPGPSPTEETTDALVQRVWTSWCLDAQEAWLDETTEEAFRFQEYLRDLHDPMR